MNLYIEKIKPFLYLGGVYLIVSFILRIIFVFHPITTSSFGFLELISSFFIGTITDIFVFTLASVFLVLYFLFISNVKYRNPYGWIIFALFIASILYVRYVPNNIFKQYGGSVEEIALIFLGIKAFCFALMLFLSKWRIQVRNVLYFITLLIYSGAIVMNAVSEYFFWNEFGIRYNFIAVDYLIYTNEVIGNIMESYPVIPLFTAIIVISLSITIFLYLKTKSVLLSIPSLLQKLVLTIFWVGLSLVSMLVIPRLDSLISENTFSREIQSNGVYKFYYAFTHSELDFFQFYPTLAQNEANEIFLNNFGSDSFVRQITSEAEELHKNVVLISVESLSAEHMQHYGNTQQITPFLDSLASKSLFFTNFYATGNRTVRGLEALTLCVPPTAGESIVKRKNNKNKFTTGSVFSSKGYQVKYLYGGYSYFDNMKDFFGGNHYDIVDRDNFTPDEITFANVWGVCDEDMAHKAIQTINQQAQEGKPFFNHWMTVSNHRPFTYPNGKIDIPGDAKSREGGVKYTDYSVKRFFEMAQKEPWFDNTIFVIVSDHCASSAGKTDLPLDRYRIPAFIYAPNFVQPQKFTKLMSQIDLMPTLFSLLNFNYQSKFLGQNVLDTNYTPRAYIATYQDLGYIKDNTLTIISPVNRVRQYELKLQPSDNPDFQIDYDEVETKEINQKYVKECISAYQSASYLLQNNMLDR